ncbi:Sir2 family NAD-dependent protein deacetylase [Flaviflexus massiliensis]|uniref:Sir2 family NAD-dependent protein deacetylase n=1 Tax=Flaviflexus massiliensis TaxID=1522309 RepID=UPI0009E938FB|nr:Sir2 family NAD-dependent protein deacetylase [Flaviflexus massiliensis]
MANSIEDYFPNGAAPRLRIKNIEAPPADAARPEPTNLAEALAPALRLLERKKLAVITGAGISTDSGLPDYRSPGSPPRNPMTIQQFMASESFRSHYWARNHVGWRHPYKAKPNVGHRALAFLEERGIVTGIITQNVDMLHGAAGTKRLVNLHGRGDRVTCTQCGMIMPRSELNVILTELNPGWAERHIDDVEIAPDADAAIEQTSGFVVADCPICGGILRTDVVFFGGTVRPEDTAEARAIVSESDAVLVAGSSLAVASALRYVREAHRDSKPIAIINRGDTRGDKFADLHVYIGTSRALPYLAENLPDL